MKQRFLLILFLLVWGGQCFSQSSFLVSCPAEIKMNGVQNYFFYSHKSYLIFNTNANTLKMVINMLDLKDQSNAPLGGQEVEYNTNMNDSNNLVFEGNIPENKIRPGDNLKDTYTFNVTGTVKFRDITYVTEIICSYGARMIRNQSQVALNVNMEILKMDYPMYIPAIKALIDNLKIEIVDGTVNMVQN